MMKYAVVFWIEANETSILEDSCVRNDKSREEMDDILQTVWGKEDFERRLKSLFSSSYCGSW